MGRVPLRRAQAAIRHSDPRLTANVNYEEDRLGSHEASLKHGARRRRR